MKRRRMLAAMAGLGAVACAGPARASGRDKPFRIYMALYRGWEECAQGFKDYLVNQNIPVELIVRDAGQDKAKLRGFADEAKSLGVDLVFTWGTTVTQEMLGTYDAVDPARHITEIPAVFAIVSQPVGAKIVPDFVSSRRNVTGTSYLVPIETQVSLIQSYRAFGKLGIVYNPQEANSRVVVEELTAQGRRSGFKLLESPVDVVDGKPSVASIASKVAALKAAGAEFLYIPPDTFINVNRDALTGAALENKLPSFAAAENPVVNSKAMFGGIYRYYTVGQLTAYKAEQILMGKTPPADIPIDAPKRPSVILNMPVVRQLGFYPPMTLLGLAEIIDPEARL